MDSFMRLGQIIFNLSVILFPTLIIFIPHGGGSILLIPLIYSLFNIFYFKDKEDFTKNERLFVLSFLLYVLIIFLSNIYHNLQLAEFDTPSRILMMIPIFIYLRRNNFDLTPSIFLGSILVISITFILFMIQDYISLNGFDFFENSLIVSAPGNASLFLTFFSFASLIAATDNKNRIYRLIYFLFFSMGLFLIIELASRGIWLSIILSSTTLFVLNFFHRRGSQFSKILVIFILIFSIFISYSREHSRIKVKVDRFVNEIQNLDTDVVNDTSIGLRYMALNKALDNIGENFWLGVGEGGFKNIKFKDIETENNQSPSLEMPHTHNEYLSSLIEQGVFGLLSLLFLFFAPFKVFLRNMNSILKSNRTMSKLGMILVLTYSYYAISANVFAHQITTLFFAFFLVLIVSRIRESA